MKIHFMSNIKKYLWFDNEITSQIPEPLEDNSDPVNKLRGGDRVEIYEYEKQEIFGFGGAFTEAAGYNYSLLDDAEKQKALALLFGRDGLNYNFCRVCIGSSDFSIDGYSYVENADEALSDFSIERDRKYVIPFIKDALAYTGGEMTLLASPWSPPACMKDNNALVGGQLREDCYAAYAKYFRRFIEEYDKEGIHIDVITPQNEPVAQKWESCVFTAEQMAALINAISNELADYPRRIKILCWDMNRGGMFAHSQSIFSLTDNRVWGTGFHWYNGVHLGEMRIMHELFPDKIMIETEFCHGFGKRMYGKYRSELIDVLDNYTSAVIEWNLMLDEDGGPYHNRDIGCYSPLFRDRDGSVQKRCVYNQMFMYSHFIKKGAHALYTSSANRNLLTLAVRNPDGQILLYIYNNSLRDDSCTVCIGDMKFKASVPSEALVLWTLEP